MAEFEIDADHVPAEPSPWTNLLDIEGALNVLANLSHRAQSIAEEHRALCRRDEIHTQQIKKLTTLLAAERDAHLWCQHRRDSSLATIEITASVSRATIMSALRNITINNPKFDGHGWSTCDADTFERAAILIRQTIAEHMVKDKAQTQIASMLQDTADVPLHRHLGLKK